MIEDSKFVKSVKSNEPKKGWKIEWHDGKFDNIFDESWLHILDEAQSNQRMVHFKKEKNNGYWNIQSLELATIEAPTHLAEAAKQQGAVEAPKVSLKDRAVCLSYAKDLAVADKIKLNEINDYADKFLMYITK
jgi:hypothetical protein